MLAIVLTFLLLPCAGAVADDTSVGGVGGDVYPLNSADIRMESETVQAIVYAQFAEYRVDFKFVNQGKAQTVTLGFPFLVTVSGDDGNAPVAFQAWQDGRPLAVTIGKAASTDDLAQPNSMGYYLHQATFPPGATMITVSYLAEPTVQAGDRFPELTPATFKTSAFAECASWYTYLLHTGATWQGTIGKAVIRYQFADSFLGWGIDIKEAQKASSAQGGTTTAPESYTMPDSRSCQWVFDDFEPTPSAVSQESPYDITLAFTEPVWAQTPGAQASSSVGPLPVDSSAFGVTASTEGWPAGFEAIDGNPASAWGIAAPTAGKWLKVDLSGNPSLGEIRILPGKNDSLTSFYENSRPKTMKVTLSDGTTQIITLEDEPVLQRFPISGRASWVQFDVLDSYPGAKSSTTYISEIDFGRQAAPSFETFADLVQEPGTATTQGGTTTTMQTAGTVSTATSQAPSTETTARAADQAGSRSGLPWQSIAGIAVAAVGLVILVFLVRRLRAKPPGTGQ